MRDHLTHRYFDTAHALVRATAERDVPDLVAARQTRAKSSLEKSTPGKFSNRSR